MVRNTPSPNARPRSVAETRSPAMPSTRTAAAPTESVVAAERGRSVGAAEAERVGERDLDLHVARGVRDVVEVAGRVRGEDVDGRRRDLVVDRERGDDGFNSAGSAQQVAMHALGGIDRQLVRM